ncbi:unnamed protein product [Meganyctiphanes norvegica]|uniref:Secreted protein n=1 Tax=Meganyctiphanes norvegica TaxID=48144 RepID=A0AAV2R6E2_MEGNR
MVRNCVSTFLVFMGLCTLSAAVLSLPIPAHECQRWCPTPGKDRSYQFCDDGEIGYVSCSYALSSSVPSLPIPTHECQRWCPDLEPKEITKDVKTISVLFPLVPGSAPEHEQ